jgi:hypothetical protein
MKINIPMTLTVNWDTESINWDDLSKAYRLLSDDADLISFYESFEMNLAGVIS